MFIHVLNQNHRGTLPDRTFTNRNSTHSIVYNFHEKYNFNMRRQYIVTKLSKKWYYNREQLIDYFGPIYFWFHVLNDNIIWTLFSLNETCKNCLNWFFYLTDIFICDPIKRHLLTVLPKNKTQIFQLKFDFRPKLQDPLKNAFQHLFKFYFKIR